MQKLRPKLSVWIALAISGMFFSAARSASADYLWNWNYKCSGETKCSGGSGTFTTNEKQGSGGNEYYLVTAITGTVEGQTITSLLAPGSLGQNNDNKIQPPIGQPFTNSGSKVTGIGFLINNDLPTTANRGLLYNILIDPIVGYDTQILAPGIALESVDFSDKMVGTVDPTLPAPVPEPSTLALLSTGALGLFGAIRRRGVRA